MTESEFLALAEGILDALEQQADKWYDDLDVDVEAVRNGNVLTLAFDSGVKVIVNSQAPMQEMWVAAPSGGFHYRLQGDAWKDTRGGPDLHDALTEICSAAAGTRLEVSL
jgi:CyaY protein